jgi:hypothetical protein
MSRGTGGHAQSRGGREGMSRGAKDGHVQSRGGREGMSRGAKDGHVQESPQPETLPRIGLRTCPPLEPTDGHNAYMPIRWAEGWTCPVAQGDMSIGWPGR